MVWQWLLQPERRCRSAGLRALSIVEVEYRHDKFLPFVVEALHDRENFLKYNALSVLQGGAYPHLMDEVIKLAKSSDDPARGPALRVLGGYRDDKVIPLLRDALLDKEYGVCRSAADALALLGTASARSVLEEYASTGTGFVTDECRRVLKEMAATPRTTPQN